MDSENKQLQPEENVQPAETKETPHLSEDFFFKLLDLPSCKSRGYCDDCGRCER